MKHAWLYSDLPWALNGKLSQLCVLNRGTLIFASALLPLQGFIIGTSPACLFLNFSFYFFFIPLSVQADDYNCKPEKKQAYRNLRHNKHACFREK